MTLRATPTPLNTYPSYGAARRWRSVFRGSLRLRGALMRCGQPSYSAGSDFLSILVIGVLARVMAPTWSRDEIVWGCHRRLF